MPQLWPVLRLLTDFPRRFLRETTIFPYQAGEGRFGWRLPIRPIPPAHQRAEIVLGGPVEVAVASFEDITTVLDERLGADDGEAVGSGPVKASAAVDDDIESLRDLASGAPVVRARQRPARARGRACAPATSTSSRSAPGSWCACASTACCAPCRRRPACRRRR